MLVFGGISFLGIRFLMKEISANNESIKKEIVDHEEREKRLAEAPSLNDQFEAVKSKEGELEVILSRSQIVTLMKRIEKIAEETSNEITVENMEVRNGELETGTKKKSAGKNEEGIEELLTSIGDGYVSMEIKLRGNYNKALNFIEKMENMNYGADIVSLQLSTERDDMAKQSTRALLSADPLTKNTSEIGELEMEENINETIINSVLGVVVYFNE